MEIVFILIGYFAAQYFNKKPSKKMDTKNLTDLQKYVAQEAVKKGYDPQIVLRQISAESAWKTDAKSQAGAYGLPQFMPATWKDYGSGDIKNPYNQVEAYFKFMDYLKKKFKGDIRYMLAAYNWGQNRKLLVNGIKENLNFSTQIFPKLPSETKNYITKIFKK